MTSPRRNIQPTRGQRPLARDPPPHCSPEMGGVMDWGCIFSILPSASTWVQGTKPLASPSGTPSLMWHGTANSGPGDCDSMSTHPALHVPELSIGPPKGGGFPSNCPHSSPKPSYTILGVRAEARPPNSWPGCPQLFRLYKDPCQGLAKGKRQKQKSKGKEATHSVHG